MADYPHPFTTMIDATEDDGLTPVWPYTREAFGLGHSPSVHDVPADPPAGDDGPSELDGPQPVTGSVVDTARVAWQKYFDVNRMIAADPTVTGTLPVTVLAPTRKRRSSLEVLSDDVFGEAT